MDDDQIRQELLSEGLAIEDIDMAFKLKDAIVRCDTIAFPSDECRIRFASRRRVPGRETWAGYRVADDCYVITVPKLDTLLREKAQGYFRDHCGHDPSSPVVEADLNLVLHAIGVHEVRHRIQHKKPWIARFARPCDVSDRDARTLTQHISHALPRQ